METTRRRTAFALVAALLAAASLAPTNAQKGSPFPAWTPPPARTAKTPFAPRPLDGDNIFKGEAERWLADAIKEIETGALTPIEDAAVTAYVSQVGRHLAAHSVAPSKQYEFIVLDAEEANAMNMGAGRIYVNVGMLKAVESEDELAGVIAHELGHDAFGHAPKTVTRQLFWMKGITKVKSPAEVESALKALLLEYEKNQLAAFGESLLGFSRFQELEADRAAFYNAYRAGYNPHALAAAFRRMDRVDRQEMGEDYDAHQFLTFLFGSHPPTSQRATALSWESNFVKMPRKDERYRNAAFDAMKARVARL